MRELIEWAVSKGGVITRVNSDRPRLLIYGESHDLKTKFSPFRFFTGIKPDYVLSELAPSGEELDYDSFKKFLGTADAETVVKRYFEGDFAGSFKEGILNAMLTGTQDGKMSGYGVRAIFKWFQRSQGTTFVGIDTKRKSRERHDIGVEAKELFEDVYVALDDFMRQKPEEIDDATYRKCEAVKEKVYENKKHDYAMYGGHVENKLRDDLASLRNDLPKRSLRGRKLKSRFRALIGRSLQYSKERERVMGSTMASYTKNPELVNLGIVGALHVRPDSLIFPRLEARKIPYVAIDAVGLDEFQR